jgi:hypothetical protein
MAEPLATDRISKIDPSVPRRLYWSHDLASATHCPKCGAALVQDFQTYAVAIEEGKQLNSFALGTDSGHFCPQCPVAVLDADGFRELIRAEGIDAQRFIVIGLVDLDAVPEEKADLPLGDDDNPLPVVEFIRNDTVRREGKIGRNDPCPCGSGKKYKKCCGGK